MKAKRILRYLISLTVILTIPVVFFLPGALAIEYSFTPIEFPGGSWTEPMGSTISAIS